MLLDTPSVMFLESSGMSGLSTSYILLQTTPLRLTKPQLVYRWLASYWPHGCPLSPQPSKGSLCHICGVAEGSSLPFSLDAQCAVGSVQGSRCKTHVPNFTWKAPCPLANLLSFTNPPTPDPPTTVLTVGPGCPSSSEEGDGLF